MKSTILATCYAINPYKGSEDGMGWNFVYQIAKRRKVIAITRENNKTAIEKYMQENPDEVYQNIQFKYFDLPEWTRFWKKGSRGALLYFYLWQRFVVDFIKKEKFEFDIAHNVNFHNDWTPTFLWKLGKPLVWGPVGHHPKIPKRYFKNYSFQTYLKDRLTWSAKSMFWELSLSLKKTIKEADYIWCMNSEVPEVLGLNGHSKYSIYPSVASEDFSKGEINLVSNFNVISVGRFVPLKGFDLAISAFAKFLDKICVSRKYYCKLTLVGSGEEKPMIERLITEHHLENNVEIIDWIDRNSLMEKYRESSVFLFPSHEGAGMVVPEALSFGLPVVTLDNIGPGEFVTSDCGFKIQHAKYKETVTELSNALLKLFLNKDEMKEKSFAARKLYEEKFSWDKRGEYLDQIYLKFEA